MRQKLLQLRQEMDDYNDYVALKTKNINLNKVNYLDEINHTMDKLNYCPQEPLLKDSYLVVLNSRLTHPCEPPDPYKVFECNGNVHFNRIGDDVTTEFNQLELRPQPDFIFTLGEERLPQPMKRILGQCEEQSHTLEGTTQMLCLSYKVNWGESKLQKWNIVTGQTRNDTFQMQQANESLFHSSGYSDRSIPWEPSQYSNSHE